MTQPQKRIQVWQLGVGILGLLVAVATCLLTTPLYEQLKRLLSPESGPQFGITFEYTLGPDHTTEYEVTNQLVWGGLPKEYWITQLAVHVQAISVPDDLSQVDVTVLNDDDEPLAGPRRWDLTTEPGPLTIALDLSKLIEGSGLKWNVSRYGINVFQDPLEYQFEKAHVSVQIGRADTGKILEDKDLTILNTPWYHYTTLSTYYPMPGGQVTAYVHAHNLGGPSDFRLVCNLWRLDSRIRFQYDWGIGDAWQSVGFDSVTITNVQDGQAFDRECTLPGPNDTFSFDEPGLYALETYLVKKQSYAWPESGTVLGCSENWRFGDPSDVFVIIVKERR